CRFGHVSLLVLTKGSMGPCIPCIQRIRCMGHMHENYGRDLDLNLLRVCVVVADAGSVTGAASRLYLTQPAVSAALKRLQRAVGAPLLARRGRGLALTERGQSPPHS